MEKQTKVLVSFLIVFLFISISKSFGQRKMEYLDRGLVAVKVSDGVFLSWRLLGTESKDLGFNVYRGLTKLNSTPIIGATNLLDNSGTMSSSYSVRTVINGVEEPADEVVPVQSDFYRSFPVTPPPTNSLPDGSRYTYHIADGSTGDLNGDGKLDLVMIWNPSNMKDNSLSGYTGNVWMDGYTLDGDRLFRIDLGRNIRAGCHYTQFVVADFDSDGKAEIMVKTAPGTKDGTGNYLSKGIASGADHSKDYRNSKGYILSGPEWLTIFCGNDGIELSTVEYVPVRGNVSDWGDSYGNRVDRFLATAAWLDGDKPSGVFQRGYYTRMAITAWDWNGSSLTMRWAYDAKKKGEGGFGQGNHSLMVGDVDNDGKDEIIQGACAIDHDGSFMYRTGLGHGDACHLGDLDPDRPGLEVYNVLESKNATYGYEMHDARTGQIIWGKYAGKDVGRGLAADIDASQRGYESWSTGSKVVQNAKGQDLSYSRGMINFRLYWDDDLLDETMEHEKVEKLVNGSWVRILNLNNYGVHANDGNKYTPCLLADLYGDWREEIVMGATDMRSVKIFTTTHLTSHRLYTLMHDPVYRTSVSWQNAAYNQPPHLGFWLGAGTENAPTPNITLVGQTDVPVTGVLVSPEIGVIGIGGTLQLKASVLPVTARNKAVSWSSNNTSVATVNSYGVVSGVSIGSAVITVKTQDGGYTASSKITVSDGGSGDCNNPKAISIPFVQEGAGDFCWSTTKKIAYINSWNLEELTINGEDFTNAWSDKLPPAQNGQWVIRYVGKYDWSHFEATATKNTVPMASGKEKGIRIYPNPFKDRLNIDLSRSEGAKRIEVINSMGQVVKTLEEGQVQEGLIKLRTESGPGLYLIRIYTEEGIVSEVIVKE